MSKIIISIDIGVKNLAITSITYDVLSVVKDWKVNFSLSSVTRTNVLERCQKLKDIVYDIVNNKICEMVIIEKQFNTNTVAMCLMYSLATIGYQLTDNVVIFSPALKFTFINETYTTKNKEHKKKSISFATNFIKSIFPHNMIYINNIRKKDDVADSFNQLITQLIIENKIDITREAYRQVVLSSFE
jgi:hypothetical protein